MKDRILLVDDDPNILASVERHLQRTYTIDTAQGGSEGLELIRSEEAYAVILSDMRMPKMSGVEFLREARILSPDSVRLMLTGNADQETAVEAINHGAVFRFLNKPCTSDRITAVMAEAVEQYRLTTAEKQLLEETLKDSVSVLIDVLSLANPVAFGKARQIQNLVRRFADYIPVERPWELEIAAMLSQLGCVTIPDDILARAQNGGPLNEDEAVMILEHPLIASKLIKNIPRLDNVARLIECQASSFQDATASSDQLAEVEMRILKAATVLERFCANGEEPGLALLALKDEQSYFGNEFLDIFEKVITSLPSTTRKIEFGELCEGMILAAPLQTTQGKVLVEIGQEVNDTMLVRVQNFARDTELVEPVSVYGSETPIASTA